MAIVQRNCPGQPWLHLSNVSLHGFNACGARDHACHRSACCRPRPASSAPGLAATETAALHRPAAPAPAAPGIRRAETRFAAAAALPAAMSFAVAMGSDIKAAQTRWLARAMTRLRSGVDPASSARPLRAHPRLLLRRSTAMTAHTRTRFGSQPWPGSIFARDVVFNSEGDDQELPGGAPVPGLLSGVPTAR